MYISFQIFFMMKSKTGMSINIDKRILKGITQPIMKWIFIIANTGNLENNNGLGHLIVYPLLFLKKESLSPAITTTDAWIPEELYR